MTLPCVIGIEGPYVTEEEAAFIRRVQPAGFVLFSRNIVDAGQTRELTTKLRELCTHTPVIAIDQEGGRVIRTAALGLHLPSARSLSRASDNDIVESARIIATSLLYLGINTDFAPVLDICRDEAVPNALPGRCWGKSPQEVITQAGMFSANLDHFGIVSCGKHFPGMGLAESDPHSALPVIHALLSELETADMLPFTALAHKLPSLMTAHILLPELDPDHPATLSRKIIHDLLRTRFGYKGVVFTDDLCMGAIVSKYGVNQAAILALTAGVDLPLICHDPLPHAEALFLSLSRHVSGEAIDREKRVRKLENRLHAPLKWNEEKWNQLIEDSKRLTDKFAASASDTPNSPVADY